MTSYPRILSHPAQALDPNVTDTRLDTDSYHRYATDHPGTLPAEEVTDDGGLVFDDA